MREGLFLDIGAYDGITFSNTYYLEKELSWNGICIEPNPVPFEKLKNNRNCILLNCGVGNMESSMEFTAVSGSGEMLSGFKNSMDDLHWKRIQKLIDAGECETHPIFVEIKKLSRILEEHNYTMIDYCNIDVEGGELEVLKSINFQKIRIKLLSVENNYNKRDVLNFLKRRGYSKITEIGADEFFEFRSRSYLLMFKLKVKHTKAKLSKIKHSTLNFINELMN